MDELGRIKRRQYEKARSARLLKDGLCLQCRSALDGASKSRCSRCHERCRANARARRERIVTADGSVCRYCLRNKRIDGMSYCQGCRDRFLVHAMRTRKQKMAIGLCGQCMRRPRMDFIVRRGVGIGRRCSRCDLCYLKSMARSALGSASMYQVLLDKLYRNDWMCPYTREKLIIGFNLSIDHIMPRSRFPELANDPRNVEPVSWRANDAKGDMTREEFVCLVNDIARNAMTITT